MVSKMKRINFVITILSVLIFSFSLQAQTIELGMLYSSGKYQSMGGSGIAVISGVSAIDFNPAGLAGTKGVSFMFSQNYNYYSYDLLRGGDGSVFNKNRSAMPFKWSKCVYDVRNAGITVPVTGKITVGAGFFQKLNPFIYNRHRALTWSCLFHHDMYGSVYAVAVSSGIKVKENLHAGLTFYNYFGTIHSTIKGDNHLKDRDKWAQLDNEMSGMNFKLGVQYRFDKLSMGFVLETPFAMHVQTKRELSEDRQYNYLFPSYEKADLKMPLVLGIGGAYTGIKDVTFTFDFEARNYKKSDVRLNLHEYALGPNWKDVYIFRTGIEFYPWKWRSVPFRAGYAYIPQLYADDIVMSTDKKLDDNNGSGQVKKHLITIGSGFSFLQFFLHAGLDYYFLNWNRTYHSGITVEDDYKESCFLVFTTLVYTFK